MRILILIAIIIGFLIFAHWFASLPGSEIKRIAKQWGLFVAGGLLILLALAGRLHWLFAIVGVALPFVARARALLATVTWLRNLRLGQRKPAVETPIHAQIETKILHLEMNRQTGVITGKVLAGTQAGRKIQTMKFLEVIALLRECRTMLDVESVRLLEIYLRRHHRQEWDMYIQQQTAGRGESDQESGRNSGRSAGGKRDGMSVEEARALLGVKAGVSRTEISAAHKRLIQKLHPDRGGSDYLAAKINKAKEILLRQESA